MNLDKYGHKFDEGENLVSVIITEPSTLVSFSVSCDYSKCSYSNVPMLCKRRQIVSYGYRKCSGDPWIQDNYKTDFRTNIWTCHLWINNRLTLYIHYQKSKWVDIMLHKSPKTVTAIILLSTLFMSFNSCVVANGPKYCMLLILHWNNKLFCCIWFNSVCGSSKISTFSMVVVLDWHDIFIVWMGISQLHGIFFLTKNDNPFYSPRGSLCHKYQNNMPSVICNCESFSKTALK